MDKLILPTYIFIFAIIFVLLFKREISDFISEIGWLKTKWFELKRIHEEVYAKAEEVKKIATELNIDKEDLRKSVRVFIETLYLALSSRHRFPIPEKISSEITKNLNVLANLAIKNHTEKSEWKKRMDDIHKLLELEVG